MKYLSIILTIITLSFTSSYAQDNEKQFAKKIDRLSKEISKNPSNADLYVERAKVVFTFNSIYPDQQASKYHLDNVIKDMNSAIEIEPKASYYAKRGEYERDVNLDLDAAISDLTKAIEIQPGNADLYLQRSNYKKVKNACSDWRACAKLGNESCEKILAELSERDRLTCK